ncbi:MAG: helix-turn-helix transcriptional regulator [Bdellovibrionaceae bacterium]|nr:helix-turn-helix transcriptional regulator [Pseudobdellovibrionaceae bacterium]
MTLKTQLKALLKQNDLSAAQLARKSGLPRQTISDWLSGSMPRNINQVKKIADAFNVSLDYLCYGEKSQKNNDSEIQNLVEGEWLSGIFEVKIRRVTKNQKEK